MHGSVHAIGFLLGFQGLGIRCDGGRHIVPGSGIQYHVHHLLHILAGGLVQDHHGHLLGLGLHLDGGNSLLHSLNNGLCGLLHGLHDGLSGLLNRLDDGLGRLLNRFPDRSAALHGFNHGRSRLLNRLDHGGGSLLNRFRNGDSGLLHGFRHRGHAFHFFFNILTGGGIENLECCHLSLRRSLPAPYRGR